jgi:Domain of unknown function (DUF4129)
VSAVRAAPAVDPDAARREAQHILSDRRFRSASTPRPLRGPLNWLGDRLETVFRPIGRLLDAIPVPVWYLVLVGLIAFVAWIITRAMRRRPPARNARKTDARAADEPEDADALERAADEAERDGDLARAVRLRFRAGLVRLGDRGAILYRPSVTTGEVKRSLDSRRFDGLAGTFEAVTYGGRPADRPAVDESRREWPHVLEESGRR